MIFKFSQLQNNTLNFLNLYIKFIDNDNPRISELAPPPNYESVCENISETGNNFTNDRLPTYEEALKM